MLLVIENLAMDGYPLDVSANHDRGSTSQKRAVMIKSTNSKTADKVFTENTTVALYFKKSEGEIAQATATEKVKNFKSKTTNLLFYEVLFKVRPTEVGFFAKATYKVQIQ